MNALVRCCRTCGLWDIEKAKDKAGRLRKDRVARCMWVCPPLPEAAMYTGNRTIVAGYSSHDQGSECKCWVERTANTKSEALT